MKNTKRQIALACNYCGSWNVKQAVSGYFDPFDDLHVLTWDDVMWDYRFYCGGCAQECNPYNVYRTEDGSLVNDNGDPMQEPEE